MAGPHVGGTESRRNASFAKFWTGPLSQRPRKSPGVSSVDDSPHIRRAPARHVDPWSGRETRGRPANEPARPQNPEDARLLTGGDRRPAWPQSIALAAERRLPSTPVQVRRGCRAFARSAVPDAARRSCYCNRGAAGYAPNLKRESEISEERRSAALKKGWRRRRLARPSP